MYLSPDDSEYKAPSQLFDTLANNGVTETVAMIRNRDFSVATLLQLESPFSVLEGAFDDVVAAGWADIANALWVPNVRAATFGSCSVGTPHAHLPSPYQGPLLGPLTIGLSASVRIGGLAVGRAGDMGVYLGCISPDPIFKVVTGSSKVFVNGRRAARATDFTLHGRKAPEEEKKSAQPGSTESDSAEPDSSKPDSDEPKDPEAPPEFGVAMNVGNAHRKIVGRNMEADESWSAAQSAQRTATRRRAADLDAEHERAEARAIAKGEAAAAAGHAEQLANRSAQTRRELALALFGSLSDLCPAAKPSFGALLPLPNWTVKFGGLPTPPALFGGILSQRGKNPISRAKEKIFGGAKRRVDKAIGRALKGPKRRIYDGYAAAKLKLRAAGAPVGARIRDALPKTMRMLSGHPVDVITGAVLTDATDAHLRGRWTLPIRRNYTSAWAARSGPLGFGWSLSLDLAIWIEPGLLVHRAPDGRELFFDLPADLDVDDAEALARVRILDPSSGLQIAGGPGGRWTITVAEGDRYSSDGIRRVELSPIAGDRTALSSTGLARATSLLGPDGAVVQLEYDPRARLSALRQGSHSLTLHWRSAGDDRQAGSGGGTPARDRLVALSLANPDGPGDRVAATYEYDPAGDLVAVTDALGYRQELEYDHHLLVREVFADGRAFTFSYDSVEADAKCIATSGDEGVYARKFDYDERSHRTEIIAGDGSRTVVFADGRGRVVETTDNLGRRWKYGYDEHDRRICERDPLGADTWFEYDHLGCRRTLRRADGTTWLFEHADDGRRIAATSPEGARWRWRHDDRGQLIEAIDPLGCGDRYAAERSAVAGGACTLLRRYGPELPMTADLRSISPSETLHLDGCGQLVRRERADGSTWSYEYDRRGRCVAEVDPQGVRRDYGYDLCDRLISCTEADGSRTVIERGPGGRALRMLRRGADIRYSYGACGRVTSVLGDPSFAEGIHYTYDAEGRLLEIAAGEQRHSFERNSLGEIIGEITSDGRSISYLRDARGQVVERIDSDGARTRYEHDLQGRIIAVHYADGASDTFRYDPTGALLDAIRDEPEPEPEPEHAAAPPLPASAAQDSTAQVEADEHGRRWRHHVELQRDACGRVIGEIIRDSGHGEVRWTATERDPMGRPRSLRSSAGISWVSAYAGPESDAASEIDVIAQSRSWRIHIARDHRDLELYRHLPGGVEVELSRDRSGRPQGQTLTSSDALFGAARAGDRAVRLHREYKWSADGGLVVLSEGGMRAGADHFARTSAKPKPRPQPTVSGAEAQLEAEIDAEIDAQHRTVRRVHRGDQQRLTWDAAGRLRRVEGEQCGCVTFDYDALGRRVRKSAHGRETTWLWDGDRPFIEEVEAGAVTVGRRAWLFEPTREGSFTPLAAIIDGRFYGLLCDHLSAPIVATNASGETVWRSSAARGETGDRFSASTSASANANTRASTNTNTSAPDGRLNPGMGSGLRPPTPRSATAAIELPFGVAGHYLDRETGLAYSRYRYFDPQRGCFLSPDPSGLRGGLDPLAYVDDPMTMVDPLGLRGTSALPTDDPSDAYGDAHSGPLDPEPEQGARTIHIDPPEPPEPSSKAAAVLRVSAVLAVQAAAQVRLLSRLCK